MDEKAENKIPGLNEHEKVYQDINLVMENGEWKHFEFQNTNEGLEGRSVSECGQDFRRTNGEDGAGEELTREDLVPLTLSMLMGGEMSMKEIVEAKGKAEEKLAKAESLNDLLDENVIAERIGLLLDKVQELKAKYKESH